MMTWIKYEQSNPIPGRILPGVVSPELFIFHMEKAFKTWPLELNKDHIERLEGMAATYKEDSNPFRVLILAIKSLGAIKVWSETNEN